MPSAPHSLIRRTVLRHSLARTQLTLLSLPNDTLVDLILVHLCVRDILRLRSVRMRDLEYYISLTFFGFRYADYSTS
jgi:hypothetical protein